MKNINFPPLLSEILHISLYDWLYCGVNVSFAVHAADTLCGELCLANFPTEMKRWQTVSYCHMQCMKEEVEVTNRLHPYYNSCDAYIDISLTKRENSKPSSPIVPCSSLRTYGKCWHCDQSQTLLMESSLTELTDSWLLLALSWSLVIST